MSAPSQKDLANALRALAMDSVQKANSGHPGMPMGMADIAEVLWNQFLHHNPNNPHWVNRDRFVLSNGHGSMLLYALLHLTGYDLSLEDLKNFRQLHSKTPGHPEFGITPGVDTTTGPLGQGIANAVGMAIAEKALAARFNTEEFKLIDHYTYVFCGDGCLMEGISHEACSLAGTLELGKVILFYDDNGISIDGPVQGWFTENIPERFKAYGWNVIPEIDGHDPSSIAAAIAKAKQSSKPSILCCKTQIAFGSPNKANTAESHGSPLGEAEILLTKKALGIDYPAFEIPLDISAAWNKKSLGKKWEEEWNQQFETYQHKYPEKARQLQSYLSESLPENWKDLISEIANRWIMEEPVCATRKASQLVLNALLPHLPFLFGGSADLTGSNNTNWSNAKIFSKDNPLGDYLHYGVREFGMAAIMNGIALHGGLIPFGGTFLVFSDYARNAIRMSALMKQRVIYVMTHDSIGLGEDGPTHQPIEHLASLRLIPNLDLWRPAGPIETLIAWEQAIERREGPSVLALSRQNLAFDVLDKALLEKIRLGGYVLKAHNKARANIIGTGSELELAIKASEALDSIGIAVNVISIPCVSRFLRQNSAYRNSVLDPKLFSVVVEAGVSTGWFAFGNVKAVVGLDHFGESAPAKAIYQALGITSEAIVNQVKNLLGESV